MTAPYIRIVADNGQAQPAYRFRTEVCEAHDTATSTSCDECVSGEVDASCCACNRVVPLDDDGFCEDCLAPVSGWELAERSALNMGRK